MTTLNREDHLRCQYYATDFQVGFNYSEIEAGRIIMVAKRQQNHLCFILSGSVSINLEGFPNHEFHRGEMAFLPKSSNCKGSALTPLKIITLTYDNPNELCNKLALEALEPFIKNIQYEFKGLEIRKPIWRFLISIINYLKDDIRCLHIHEIKQKELFIILRFYYTKEELAHFFYPIIGKNMDFKARVLENYQKVKTAEELAQILNMGEKTFHRLFKKNFDQTPYQWMQQQTSRHIKAKLQDKHIPIKQIIDDFRFSSASHFNEYCKRHFNATPRQIRYSEQATK